MFGLNSYKDYPRTIKINGKLWKISFRKKIFFEGEECRGLCNYDKKTIYMDKTIDKDVMFQTFIHECLHAIMGIRDNDKIPHDAIYLLEKKIHRFLRENLSSLS